MTAGQVACSSSDASSSDASDVPGTESRTADGDGGTAAPSDGSFADGGPSSPEGSTTTDADASNSTTKAPRVACGQGFCRADQTCNAGACEYACVGKQVPGDYASLEQAVLALANQKAVICYHAPATLPATSTEIVANADLTIVAVSSAHAKTESLIVQSGNGALTMKGIDVDAIQVQGGPSSVTMVGSRFRQLIVAAGHRGDVVVDGAEIRGSISLFTGDTAVNVTIENSYFDGTTFAALSVNGSAAKVAVLYNTFDRNNYGIGVFGTSKVTAAGNILVHATETAINTNALGAGSSFSNNLLFANNKDYGGSAADGPGYVKADPLFDTSKPPELAIGSPARGAGALGQAPPTDYYGTPRVAGAPDLGAVQPR